MERLGNTGRSKLRDFGGIGNGKSGSADEQLTEAGDRVILLHRPSIIKLIEMVKNRLGILTGQGYRLGLCWESRETEWMERATQAAINAIWLNDCADCGGFRMCEKQHSEREK